MLNLYFTFFAPLCPMNHQYCCSDWTLGSLMAPSRVLIHNGQKGMEWHQHNAGFLLDDWGNWQKRPHFWVRGQGTFQLSPAVISFGVVTEKNPSCQRRLLSLLCVAGLILEDKVRNSDIRTEIRIIRTFSSHLAWECLWIPQKDLTGDGNALATLHSSAQD